MLSLESWFVLIFGFILGTILGSYAKALADRSILDKPYLGRSYCLSCKKTLRWYDLFPILSYLSLKGRCRYCHKKIPPDNFLTEFGTGVLAALIFFTTIPTNFLATASDPWQMTWVLGALLFKLFVATVLVVVFIVDLKTYLILDRIVIPASALAVIYLMIELIFKSYLLYQSILVLPFGRYLLPPYSNYFLSNLIRLWSTLFETVLAGVVAAACFSLIIILTRGRGMGWGDVKYVFFLGLALGFPNLVVGLFLAFLIGAICAIALVILNRKEFGQTIPFGPFLSLGAFIALLWGPQIIDLYLKFSLHLGTFP